MGKSIREVYGTVLAELGGANENIVVLDADLSGSTKSGIFGKAHPERHFNMGIAESDMVATAAGLATTGKIPFVNTFTVFLTTLGLISARAQVCYGNLNVKFGGAYCGMSDALDGATHHATEDIAVMRALPNMTVLVPSDAASTCWATKYAVDTYGPMYLRLSRDVYPDLYDENTKFECGKGAIVRDGTDVTVIACGILVHKALEAADADGLALDAAHALRFALRLLRADAAADGGQGRGLMNDLIGALIVLFGDLLDEFGDLDLHRAAGDAGMVLAV